MAGVDPEPDMLARARQVAAEQGIRNVNWLLGADTDIPALAALLGCRRAGAVTIGQALHWMRYRELIPALVPLLRPGGGIAVITNGTPMWLQDSPWSQALRGFLEQWMGATLASTCGTDDASQERYRDSMTGAGLGVEKSATTTQTSSTSITSLAGSIPRCQPRGCPGRTSGQPSPPRSTVPSPRTPHSPSTSRCGCCSDGQRRPPITSNASSLRHDPAAVSANPASREDHQTGRLAKARPQVAAGCRVRRRVMTMIMAQWT